MLADRFVIERFICFEQGLMIMVKKYLYETIKKGTTPKDVTLLLTKCFGEEYMSPKYDCFHCQVRNRCRYIQTKGIKNKLRKKFKKEIDAKLKEKEQAPVKSKKKKVIQEKKEISKELKLAENKLKKDIKKADKGKFKVSKKELKQRLGAVKKAKKVIKRFFS